MQFELTEALINDILFSMEDQDGEFLVDTQEGVVTSENDEDFEEETGENEDRYISLPEWESSDGFRLMERFAAGLRNPMLRTELSSALNRGKGVFRAFKDILGRYPEAERFWFAHKEREMKRQIIRWYNSLREEWGLARIGEEPEDTADLVLEDFRFRAPEEGDAAAAEELHGICIGEYRKYAAENGIEAGAFPENAPWAFPGSAAGAVGLVAETGGGEFAGYVSAACEGPALHINALEVRPEYRGLGIGEALVSRFLEKATEEKIGLEPISCITIDLPAGAEGFSRVLLRSAFKTYAIRYCMTLPVA
jgi:GNAT superfamily N-acetyltransferase